MKKELAVVPKEVVKQDVSIEAILTQAIDKGVPVETMERLMAMRRELKAEWAKEQYDRAMAKFQSECPEIAKTKAVYTDNGRLAYKYAPIESIVAQVKIPLEQNGFSYKTDQELKEKGVKVTVIVTHAAGHHEETSMEVPFGAKTRVMSDSQVSAAATTFAKRYAFCNAFGILTGDEDTDAKKVDESEGVVIHMDEKVVSPPLPKARKDVIAGYLHSLGHPVRTMTKAAIDEQILTYTGLDMVPVNYNKIEALLKERIDSKSLEAEFTKP